MTLPTNRTTSSTPEEHVADHNTIHAFVNAPGDGAVSCNVGTGAAVSGAVGDLIPSHVERAGTKPNLTLCCGPLLIGAGGTVAFAELDAGVAATIDYIELFVSNAAGTQSLAAYSANPFAMTAGSHKTMGFADWYDPPDRVGTDLSINGSGLVVSAAGGVFWATVLFRVTPP